ncbi:MAG: peptidylprolyl isomerase [Mucilaginibacter polytrichastri]|nr:peptidylprolyl isomerase [Mucilaginibacter polytrichastri]
MYRISVTSFIAALLLFVSANGFAQNKRLDGVVGVVGSSIILESEVEMGYAQMQAQGMKPNPEAKCNVLQQLLSQKLLAQQAVIDSVSVTGEQVDEEIDRRMRYMTQRAGGQEALENFLGRSMLQYKEEVRPDVQEQLVAQKMQGTITEKVNVTPAEVKKFFNSIPKDSLPTYNKEVEVGEIVFEPKLNKEEKQRFRDKLEALRTRIKNGEDFGTLARLYSEDPGSATQGGDLGFFDRQMMTKEFTAWAFRLKPNEISPVFETEYGFHFLQVTERRGEQARARHILIMTEPTEESLERTRVHADSVYAEITKAKTKLTFNTAASMYSDDKATKFNGGMMLDNQTRSTYIPTDKLEPEIALAIDTMKAGGYSRPGLFSDPQTKKQTYRILYLKSVTDAHQASLAEDFPKIKEIAYNDKINRTVSKWFENRRKETFIRIDPQYQSCPSLKSWVTTPDQANAQAQNP